MRTGTRSTFDREAGLMPLPMRPVEPAQPVQELRPLNVVDLGETGYLDCWETQRRVHAMRRAGRCADTLLLTIHRHVYTIGKGGDDNHLLAGPAELAGLGAEMVRTDRGGDITYHGPGQLVAYPVIDLAGRDPDVHRYLRDLEQVVIGTIADHGIAGEREPEYTGVWAGGEKIAAIGIRVAGWVTMHGFALNVSTDLTRFHRIIPCGISHLGVTSMERCLGRPVPMDAVRDSAVRHFERIFSSAGRTAALGEILRDEQPATPTMPTMLKLNNG
jgi:lipoyl(octanoyl) transferase